MSHTWKDLYCVTVDYLLGRSVESSNLNTTTEVLAPLPVLHSKPVWASEYGWGIVNSIQKHVVFMDGVKIPFDNLNGLSVIPPAFTVGYHPMGTPMSHDDLPKHKQRWIEPILPGNPSALKNYVNFLCIL